MKLKLRAAAKLNLTLDVTAKREDGYHELKSIMQAVSLFETITIEENISGIITITCDLPGVPCDKSNIAAKCAAAYYEAAGIQNKGLHIDIQKHIPMQAGLAGGSADGAAVLYGLNHIYKKFNDQELVTLAASIGADIPFCLMGGTALAEGIGEKLTPLEFIPECTFVIIKPDIGISTAQAYGAVDKFGMNSSPSTDVMLRLMSSAEKIASFLHNDFEAALNIPQIYEACSKLNKCSGCLGAQMTGSGSAVFGIFENENDAKIAEERLFKEYPFVKAVKPCKFGVEITKA